MPIRGAKNPVPAKKPATNSGMFSNSGAGQKMDPVKRSPKVAAAFAEAYKNTNYKVAKM